MGRGRKGPIDQSEKKPKILKNKVSSLQVLFKHEIGKKKKPPIPVSEELLAEMKKMSPQDLMNSLINPDELIDLSEEEEEEEDQDYFDWSHTPEPVYERPIPTRELVEQMRTMSREQVRYIIERALAN